MAKISKWCGGGVSVCVVVVCVCVLDRLKNRGDDYMYNHDFIIQTKVFCNNFQKKSYTTREKKV